MGYDELNNKTNEVLFLEGAPYATNRWAYDTNGLVRASYNALHHRHRFEYDDHGNLVWQEDPLGNVVASFLDSDGNITNTIHLDPGSNVLAQASWRYEAGLLVWSRDAVGTVTTNVYDSAGNLTGTATLDASGVILSTNSFGYDANGNQTEAVVWRRVNGAWEGATNQSIFDAQGRVVQSIDALGFTNATVYNALGRVEQSIDKLERVTRYRV